MRERAKGKEPGRVTETEEQNEITNSYQKQPVSGGKGKKDTGLN